MLPVSFLALWKGCWLHPWEVVALGERQWCLLLSPAGQGTCRIWALEATRCQGYSVTAVTAARCGTAGLAWRRTGPLCPPGSSQGQAMHRSWKSHQELGENPGKKWGGNTVPLLASWADNSPSASPMTDMVRFVQWPSDYQCCRNNHPKWPKACPQSHECLKNCLFTISQPGACIYSQGGSGLAAGYVSDHHLDPHFCIDRDCEHHNPPVLLISWKRIFDPPSRSPQNHPMLKDLSTKTYCFGGKKSEKMFRFYKKPRKSSDFTGHEVFFRLKVM